jgi:hypothetical protein
MPSIQGPSASGGINSDECITVAQVSLLQRGMDILSSRPVLSDDGAARSASLDINEAGVQTGERKVRGKKARHLTVVLASALGLCLLVGSVLLMDAGDQLSAVEGFLEHGPNRGDALLSGTVGKKAAAAHRLAVLAQQPGIKVVEARPLQSLAKVSAVAEAQVETKGKSKMIKAAGPIASKIVTHAEEKASVPTAKIVPAKPSVPRASAMKAAVHKAAAAKVSAVTWPRPAPVAPRVATQASVAPQQRAAMYAATQQLQIQQQGAAQYYAPQAQQQYGNAAYYAYPQEEQQYYQPQYAAPPQQQGMYPQPQPLYQYPQQQLYYQQPQQVPMYAQQPVIYNQAQQPAMQMQAAPTPMLQAQQPTPMLQAPTPMLQAQQPVPPVQLEAQAKQPMKQETMLQDPTQSAAPKLSAPKPAAQPKALSSIPRVSPQPVQQTENQAPKDQLTQRLVASLPPAIQQQNAAAERLASSGGASPMLVDGHAADTASLKAQAQQTASKSLLKQFGTDSPQQLSLRQQMEQKMIAKFNAAVAPQGGYGGYENEQESAEAATPELSLPNQQQLAGAFGGSFQQVKAQANPQIARMMTMGGGR